MNSDELRKRTKQFALRIIKLAAALPRSRTSDVRGRQVLRSGTSIGANYREALRASSRRHFVTTPEIAIREGEETLYWLELLAESNTVKPSRLSDLTRECGELVAILTATVRTTKRQILNHNWTFAKRGFVLKFPCATGHKDVARLQLPSKLSERFVTVG